MNRLGIRFYWTGLLWSCLFLPLIGQSDQYLDRVALTNGSVLWGIVEIDEGGVKVYMDDDNLIFVQDSLIKSLKYQKLNPELYLQRANGVYYQVSTGVLLGKQYRYAETGTSLAAWFTSGYKFKRMFGLGLGVGLNYFPQQRHVPLYLDIQGDILPGRVTPFYQLNTGWSWADERDTFANIDKVEGGFFLRPAVGVRWHYPKHSWHLQVSYVRQNATTFYEPVDFGNGSMQTNVEDRVFQRLGLSIGLSF